MSKETLSTSEPKKTENPKHINALEEKYKEEATQEPHAKRLHSDNIRETVKELPKPVGFRILVLPFTPKEKTKGGILFSQEQLDKARISTTCGYVLELGDLAYKDKDLMMVHGARSETGWSSHVMPDQELKLKVEKFVF